MKTTNTCCGILTAVKKRTSPVIDILLWVQCYAALVAVLALQHPQKIPEFMAYQSVIIKCHRDFEVAHLSVLMVRRLLWRLCLQCKNPIALSVSSSVCVVFMDLFYPSHFQVFYRVVRLARNDIVGSI